MGTRHKVFALLATICLCILEGDGAAIIGNETDQGDIEILKAFRGSPFIYNLSPEVESELLLDMVVPEYFDVFLKHFEDIQQGSNPIEDLIKLIGQLFNGVESEDCKGHIFEWIWRLKMNKTGIAKDWNKWVLQMADSWGKVPEGILTGHLNSYGDFDECMKLKASDLTMLNPLYPKPAASFEGRYCTVPLFPFALYSTPKAWPPGTNCAAKIPPKPETETRIRKTEKVVSLEELLKLMGKPGVAIYPSLGVCLPNTCSDPDIQQLVVNALSMIYLNQSVPGYPAAQLWPCTMGCYDSEKPDFDAADISVMALISVIAGLCLGAGIIDYWLNHGVDKPPKRGLAYQYFMAFSLYTNIQKWMSTRKGSDDLGCLHGVRFLSTSWVVLAHTYYVITFLPQWNMVDVKTVYDDWSVLTIINSTFSVDTFFVMSGMLVAYNVFKLLDKSKGKINIPMFYVHRYLRLTPTYAILVGIMATLIPYLGNGPYWQVMTRWGNICENNWWTNLLYVNNFVNTSWLCQGEAWYLANDMQFYIVSPFIIYPMWKWEMMGTILLAIYTILSCISPALLVHFYDTTPTTIPTRGDNGAKWFTHIYIRPYARIQTFLVGVWLGWLLHKTKGKRVNLPIPLVVLFWALSTAICLFVIYGVQPWFEADNEIPKVAGLAYAGLSRFGWGLAVSWVIFACIKGYGGIVNSFLSWSVFMPLGRLCYCVYLVSLHLQMILHVRFTQPMRFDGYTQLNFFFAHLLMSLLVGFVATLLFESPFMILQKLIFEGGGGGGPRPQNPANAKRPSKRYGIFYNNQDTIINAQVTEPTEKERTD